MNYPNQVTLVEVGPRDGLQNEITFVSTRKKIELINQLSQSGLKRIEATSFVSPKAIPQLSDNLEVYAGIDKPAGVQFSALVPNTRGLQRAIEAGVTEIAVFTAASEEFNRRNINCSIAESLARIAEIIPLAQAHQIKIRGYVSCVVGCPYEGAIAPEKVLDVARELAQMGIYEISLGDTIGVATPRQTTLLLEAILKHLPAKQIAMHFHDTYGQAIANIHTSLQCGITCFDSSVAGLGGCPYARGASGNVATEDVLYLMHGLGIETGVDIYKIVHAGDMICKAMSRKNQSKVANALLANPC
ncbi:hydroxymethylglutaryl-CoA lyase [Legionella taurinensis]|uniref:hydroxymethylglutaryl-CoA lyase n=1 Tax=Legionella taurinensis TaxID=70611 RepID=A0A3A5L861_9GAMM|nr:hydroxymethylglutaryl-CoA lyase [Legionella taurinensis]MDX1836498.1 hydroxymethylglutaryl-CoA lyase [Legionella taurinensis]PUT43155.1 hydroxymethylglutaryl-CoA lyase [Legionella taurinensis]PUT45194.1 hydroxymethylglutaryl-CoA lyase [Legionella taurinensis]PUT45708.1 hydroxymethylglutaryl-CoA lyase [Legionella taurinensis]PUT49477.1 hydroxymethylglutaryl-CoA lyase [Legionella taurinensis]